MQVAAAKSAGALSRKKRRCTDSSFLWLQSCALQRSGGGGRSSSSRGSRERRGVREETRTGAGGLSSSGRGRGGPGDLGLGDQFLCISSLFVLGRSCGVALGDPAQLHSSLGHARVSDSRFISSSALL